MLQIFMYTVHVWEVVFSFTPLTNLLVFIIQLAFPISNFSTHSV